MAQGVNYPTKAQLIAVVKEYIFPNRRKGITGANHQQAVLDMIESLWRDPSTGVQTVTGTNVDNTDPLNPIVNILTTSQIQSIRPLKTVGGVTLEGTGDVPIPAQGVQSVTGDGVDNTDPANPVLSYEDAASIKTKYESNLDTNAYTDAEKTKLAGLESSKFVGQYPDLASLQTAYPTAPVGSYAYVDGGVGQDVTKYIWDNNDSEWVEQLGESAEETPATIKAKYESNPDTNAFTDAEQTNLSNQSGVNTGDETISSIQTKRPLKTVDNQSLEGPGNISVGVKTVTGNVVNNTDPENPSIDINISEQAFSNTVAGSTLTMTRFVTGDNVRISGVLNVDNSAQPSGIRNTINDVIPQDFQGKKWFKLTRVTMVMDAPATSGAYNGYFELDEVSSYSGGSLTTDVTTLFIPGNSIGASRTYNVDGFNQTTGPATGGMTDRIEDFETDNYITSSPKDLTLSGFNVGWINAAQSLADYGVPAFSSNAIGYTIRFVFEGYLM